MNSETGISASFAAMSMFMCLPVLTATKAGLLGSTSMRRPKFSGCAMMLRMASSFGA
ncbi:hypothetical protein D3C72_2115050 [compost metagenome]